MLLQYAVGPFGMRQLELGQSYARHVLGQHYPHQCMSLPCTLLTLERENPRYEKASKHEVNHGERRPNLHEVRKFIASRAPYECVSLVTNGRDEG